MHERQASCRVILLIMLLPVLYGGCLAKEGHRRYLQPDVSAAASPMMSVNERITATARIDIETAQGRYPMRFALIIQKPSSLRLEMLPVIGTPDLFLVATPEDLKIWIPSKGEFYVGKPTAANVARFLSWGMNIEDLVSILTGSCPSLAGDQPAGRVSEEDGLLRVDTKQPQGVSRSVWMKRNGTITKLVRYDSSGREIHIVEYEYDDSTSMSPRGIYIRSADRSTSMTLKYSEWQIEKATEGKVFELTAPEGATIIQME